VSQSIVAECKYVLWEETSHTTITVVELLKLDPLGGQRHPKLVI
jgi:hypothetical protein